MHWSVSHSIARELNRRCAQRNRGTAHDHVPVLVFRIHRGGRTNGSVLARMVLRMCGTAPGMPAPVPTLSSSLGGGDVPLQVVGERVAAGGRAHLRAAAKAVSGSWRPSPRSSGGSGRRHCCPSPRSSRAFINPQGPSMPEQHYFNQCQPENRRNLVPTTRLCTTQHSVGRV